MEDVKLNQIKLEQIKQRLTAIEAYIIINREGLDGSKMTLSEIGKQLNISGARVSQIQKKAYEKLESKYFNDKICIYDVGDHICLQKNSTLRLIMSDKQRYGDIKHMYKKLKG